MAVWQFDFHAVKHGSSEDEDLFWNIPFEDINYIDFLKQEKSWMDDTIQFGNLEQDCIEISLSNGLVESIFARIDVRDIDDEKLSKICAYLKRINADILYDNKILPANAENLSRAIMESKEYCYFHNYGDRC